MQVRVSFFFASFILAALTTAAQAVFVTSFETPTYTSGQLSGQDSWTGTNPATVRVLTASEIAAELTAAGQNAAAPVHSGTQAVLVSGPPPASGSNSSSTFRPIAGLATEDRVVLDVWARPLPPGSEGSTIGTNVGNIFMTMEDNTGDRAAAFRFGVTDTGTSIDYGTAIPGFWTPSGQTWAPDTWYQLTMDADYSSRTYDFYVNGAKQNAEPIPFYTPVSENFSQARIFRGSGQAGMIVDDLSVAVPEPAGLACLLLAGGTALLRRRSLRA